MKKGKELFYSILIHRKDKKNLRELIGFLQRYTQYPHNVEHTRFHMKFRVFFVETTNFLEGFYYY
ncbi:hypothetical protein BACCIP111895_02474 [Neobacillus rhizosphaerae]|uniref:Homing endonuclease LAGLIDADG domain-containing protein n=1 Tax=Neobacillus rhizosphaerae TaxID=2880965 RepID=A0ABM9ERL2_9BACI|nr:hypothetical protein BACCIP111895_02474 [Neobacillus rhizosphaerae]